MGAPWLALDMWAAARPGVRPTAPCSGQVLPWPQNLRLWEVRQAPTGVTDDPVRSALHQAGAADAWSIDGHLPCARAPAQGSRPRSPCDLPHRGRAASILPPELPTSAQPQDAGQWSPVSGSRQGQLLGVTVRCLEC